jgi:simple sugar transport system substrate-binding protein
MKKKSLFVVSVMIIVAMLASCTPAATQAPASTVAPAATSAPAAEEQLAIATVVKGISYNWFQRMDTGIKQFGTDYNVKTFMEGPSQVDSAAQVGIIEDLIAQGVDGICNVPYGIPENEPATKKAMDDGIVVVGHEAATAKGGTLNYSIEAFDNKSYGEEMMTQLATRMGGKGKYVQFVGSLTNASHNEWTDAAKAYQMANYPDMVWVGKYDSKEDAEVSYNTMKDLLKTNPDIQGVQGSSGNDVVGAGRAIEEAGLADSTAVVGTSLPSMSGELLKTGAVDLIMSWDPALAGYACNVVIYKIIKNEPITEGMDLKVDGFNQIRIVTNDTGLKVIYGNAWLEMDATNMDQYDF